MTEEQQLSSFDETRLMREWNVWVTAARELASKAGRFTSRDVFPVRPQLCRRNVHLIKELILNGFVACPRNRGDPARWHGNEGCHALNSSRRQCHRAAHRSLSFARLNGQSLPTADNSACSTLPCAAVADCWQSGLRWRGVRGRGLPGLRRGAGSLCGCLRTL